MELKFLDVAANFLNGDEWWQVGILLALLISLAVAAVSFALMKLANAVKMIHGLVKSIENQPPKDYRPQIYRDTDISSLLKTIKHDLQADRVSVYQYHNGERSIANNPFLKFSCTHENLKAHTQSVQKYMTGIPVSVFGYWNRQIFDGEVVAQPNIMGLADQSDMRTAMQELRKNGTTGIYLFPMIDPMGHTFGFGMVEYCCEITKLNDRRLGWTGKQFSAIGTLLSQGVLND